MDWKRTISELIADGMTQAQIADEIGVTQGAVSQVYNSDSQRRGFRYEPGQKLIALHERRFGSRRSATPEAA
ncbi:transcriptional regulator [Ralstonia insidiosa]|uniref:transcriptional regulator n=1 Tax=Ralstonia insidiosa TaxID=190721 RepID=UPI000CEDA685|nr:transcriptional regulator [Ralstonia insidiosa]